jgi:hypothetical protein
MGMHIAYVLILTNQSHNAFGDFRMSSQVYAAKNSSGFFLLVIALSVEVVPDKKFS